MQLKDIKILISEVKSICKKYDDISEINGERFNIFNILGLSTNEVRTHSAFIGELLNPKGSHGLGNIFLEEFLKYFRFDNIHLLTAKIEIEKRIGLINKENTYGGNIDLIISDNFKNAVIIENKIYAIDQQNQLKRYKNYANSVFKSHKLLYLTLQGNDPSDSSSHGLCKKQDFINISYSDDIKQWLLNCKEKSVNQPLVRETITQYINLINQLTGQTNNVKMKDEIIKKITSDSDNLRSFFELHKFNILIEVQAKLLVDFKCQVQEVANKYDMELIFPEDFGLVNDSEFHLKFNNLKTDYYLSFGFCGKLSRFVYGIFSNSPYKNEHRQLALANLEKGLGWSNWLWISEFEIDLKEWQINPDPWLAIIDGETMKSSIDSKVNMLVDFLINCIKD